VPGWDRGSPSSHPRPFIFDCQKASERECEKSMPCLRGAAKIGCPSKSWGPTRQVIGWKRSRFEHHKKKQPLAPGVEPSSPKKGSWLLSSFMAMVCA
jgi:hypothetical protein